MPLPVVTRNHFIWDFRDTFTEIFNTFVNSLERGFTANTPVLTTQLGYRAINFVRTDSVFEYHEMYVYMPLAATETMPARLVLSRPGFDGMEFNFFGSGSHIDKPTFDTLKNYWLSSILELKKSILDDWCNASVTGPVTTDITSASNHTGSAVSVITVTTDAECMISVESLTGYNVDLDTSTTTNDARQPPVIAGVGNSVTSFPPGVFEAIIDNLSLIALRDYQISFNHSQTIFSAMGGVITG